jgi:hypothetical protein
MDYLFGAIKINNKDTFLNERSVAPKSFEIVLS